MLGREYWSLPASVRPGEDEAVGCALNRLQKPGALANAGSLILKRGRVYVFRIEQSLYLPTIVSARATGKSSVGRLDVLTRLLCDRGASFDEVRPGYRGPLFVEVISNSFDIQVHAGRSCLNQLRLFWGEPSESRLPLRKALWAAPEGRVLYQHALFHGEDLDSTGVRLRVSTEPDASGAAAYCAKMNVPGAIDVDAEKNTYRASEFWDVVEPESFEDSKGLCLQADKFYILASKERFLVPPALCVECRAYQETLGEYRIHYAGFAHPGFGSARPAEGTPLMLEVRPHSANVVLFGHEPIAQVEFYRMSKPNPDDCHGEAAYETQELQLSKYFQMGE